MSAGVKSKLGFDVLFNSQGHIVTGPQHCHLLGSNPHRGECDCDQMPNLLTTRPQKTCQQLYHPTTNSVGVSAGSSVFLTFILDFLGPIL